MSIDTIRRVYISGPITGRPALNKPAFDSAAQVLRGLGLEPVNPHNNGVDQAAHWQTHMRADIKLLMDCHAVALLPGWDDSRGARIEMRLADTLGIPVCTLAEVVAGKGWHPVDAGVLQ